MILSTSAKDLYYEYYGQANTALLFSHGRLEILGNHTDHNHGLCLVGGVDLGITAAVTPSNDNIVRIVSRGYRPFSFSVEHLEKNEKEFGTSLALTKGVMDAMKRLGFRLGGFTAALSSDIPSGSGVSSSACYESLIVKIVDHLYNGDIVSPLSMAKIGQYAENVYFGKPCGLLDQVGTSYGGVCYLDFGDMENVLVAPMKFDLPLDVTLVNTPSSHAGLTALYAEIPADMKAVARNYFHADFLREVDPKLFHEKIVLPGVGVSERAKLRASHFFDENQRVADAKRCIERGNVPGFLQDVKMSELSSEGLLANTMVPGQYQNSPQQAIDYANQAIGNGACRIMGGGFAGSILCFTIPAETEAFRAHMAKGYGDGNVYAVQVLNQGPIVIGE